MLVFGAVFLVTTILIILFKNENGSSTLCFLFKKSSTYKVSKVAENDAGEIVEDFEHEKLNLISTYKTIFRIFKLIPIRKFAFFLLTSKVSIILECLESKILKIKLVFVLIKLR